MDNRRAPGSSDPTRYVSEVGTDTVPVKLVELQAVGGAKRRNPVPIVLVALAVVALVAFGLGASLGKSPAASPTAPAAALSSDAAPTAPTTPAASAKPRVTPGPTIGPTPAPTNPNEWTWNRMPFSPGPEFGFLGMWAVGERIVALGHHEDSSGQELLATAALEAPDISTWTVRSAPPAISGLRGLSAIDDRLWALARVRGVSDDQATWQLVSTSDGSDWEAFGPSTGIKQPQAAAFIARTKGQWVLGVDSDAAQGDEAGHLYWSADGIGWHEGVLPKLPGRVVDFFGAGRLGDKVVVLGRALASPFSETTFAVTTSDGDTWRKADLTLPTGAAPTDLACIEELCLTITNSFVEPPGDRFVLVTYEGTHWTKAPLDVIANDLDNEISVLRLTPVGFMAMVGATGQVVRSFDGVAWQVIPVLPPDRAGYVSDLAAAGNLVVAYSPGDAETPPGMWTGLVGALPPMPELP